MALDKTSLPRNTCFAIQLSSVNNAMRLSSLYWVARLIPLSFQFKTQFVSPFSNSTKALTRLKEWNRKQNLIDLIIFEAQLCWSIFQELGCGIGAVRRLPMKLFQFFSIMPMRAQRESFKVGFEVMQMESNKWCFQRRSQKAARDDLQRTKNEEAFRGDYSAVLLEKCERRRHHLEKLFVRQRRSEIAEWFRGREGNSDWIVRGMPLSRNTSEVT